MNQSKSKPEQPPTTSTLKPILFIALTLISGIVIGSGLTLIVTSDSDNPKSLPPAPEYMSSRMVEHIVRELKLSPEQHEQIQPIVQQHTKAMDDIRNEARPLISNEIKLMNEEITTILDEEQKKLWEKKNKEMQDNFTRMRQRRGQGDRRRDGRDGRDSDPERRRDDRRQGQGDRPRERTPEGQLPPPGEDPPTDGMPSPELSPPPEIPPADNIN